MSQKNTTTKMLYSKTRKSVKLFIKMRWFAIEDVVAALTDSIQPKGYIKDMRRRDKELSEGWGQIATPFKCIFIDENSLR